jgi:hypothetical protein
MSEVIDDKVDKFREALTKRTGRKAAAIAMFLVLLAALYIRATYKEYDQMGDEQSWSIVRRVVMIDGQLKGLNISFGQFGFPLSYGANETTMTYCGNFTEKGHSVYWESAYLAGVELQTRFHVVVFLGHVESRVR